MLRACHDLPNIIQRLAGGNMLPGEITAHHVKPAQRARYSSYPSTLSPQLVEVLKRRGITAPYSHQRRAFDAIMSGRHVVLTTPTASGKTLCYNVPILDRILADPDARALYIFPTKALSQDQYHGVHRLIDDLGAPIRTYTFDGDTPPEARRAVRDHGHVVITNPDMLHSGVLPQHTKWLKLFENLRYVVIDELHTYRGIFGSHVAHLLRRLRRVARFHGSDPQFIACSATIQNPVELAQHLVGDDFVLIDESGAPTGEHHLITYNPPVINRQLQIRQGAVRGAHQVMSALLDNGISTIGFARSRLHVEILLKYLRESLARDHQDPSLVQGYRGGYLPTRRRRIEAGLRQGTLRGVVTTNALEAGIDIGSLDACVLCGYPGSIASFWQQSGRAGRRSGASLTVFVAGTGPIDQYLVNHPEIVVGASPEAARINPRNLFVLVDHAKCAAFELPFEPDEPFAVLDQAETQDVLGYLSSHGVVHESGGRFHWMDRAFPAHHVNLRGSPEQNFAVIEVPYDRVIAEVDFRSAHTTLHTHAIYHLDSRQYQVERLDYENHKAYVRKVDPDYYTTAMTYTKVQVLQDDAVTPRLPFTLAHGEVLVAKKFVGFKKIRFHTNETIGYGDIHLPDLEMHTTAAWFDVPKAVLDALPHDRETLADGLDGLAFALRTAASVALMCSPYDLGRAVEDNSAGAKRVGQPARAFDPTVFLYDAMPGGVGLAEQIHGRFDELLGKAIALIEGCACESGCPACLGAVGRYAGGLREAALALARVIAHPATALPPPRPRVVPAQ